MPNSLFRRIEHCFQLPVGPLLVIRLQALEPLQARFGGPRVTRARTLLLQAPAQQQRGHLILGLPFEGGAKMVRRCGEFALLPKRVTEIEMINGVLRIALDRLAKTFDRLRQIAAALGGAQVIVDLAERNRLGDHLERLLRSGVVAGLEARQTEEKGRLAVMGIVRTDFFQPLARLPVVLTVIVNAAELEAGMGEARVQTGSLRKISFFLLGSAGQQTADVVLFRIQANRRTERAEVGFRRR